MNVPEFAKFNTQEWDYYVMKSVFKGDYIGVDPDNPVSVMPGKQYMKFKNKCEKLPITLKLSYPLDREIYDKIENLFIL